MMDTSQEAFEVVKPHINELHRKIMAAIEQRDGATVSEIVRMTGVIYGTVLRRMSELKRMRLIENTDQRRCNHRGRDETVVRLVKDGPPVPLARFRVERVVHQAKTVVAPIDATNDEIYAAGMGSAWKIEAVPSFMVLQVP